MILDKRLSAARSSHLSPRGLVLGLVASLALVGCAGSVAGEAGQLTEPPTGFAASAAPDVAAATRGETAEATVGTPPQAQPGETPAPGTPLPSLPRVAPLQPPAHASRVVFADLGIDLAVISGDLQPPPSYPFCDVAAYVTRFHQPYEPGITYISAHAQRGMFLSLLQASERNDGQELLGKSVDVYVDDGRLFTYRIERVVRHAIDYSALTEIPLAERHLVLQTSEGPFGTLEKLQVIAQLESETTADVDAANPVAAPRDCEPVTAP